ncbi:MAG: biotin--[Oscillospiraceae bacterium]|nr:biotin--[acetyl-CoA-carboxylase] ligase [Oscillospiraceae bacterium]
GVSRTAIWKAMDALRQEGYIIEAATNRGYRLSSPADIIAGDLVAKKCGLGALQIEFVRETTGTNAVLKTRAAAGEPEGTVLIAGHQTAGKGRYGREFYSPEGTGLYLSIILRPKMPAERAQLITCLAAVAAAEAIEEVSGRQTQIKWVNDLLLDGRKVAGILTEASISLETGGLDWAVLGIGFNLADPAGGWGPLEGVAGSVFGTHAPAGSRADMAASFLRHFWSRWESFEPGDFLEPYRRRQAAFGRTIEVLALGREPRKAVATDVDGDFRLVVRYEDGREEHLSSGEMRIILNQEV